MAEGERYFKLAAGYVGEILYTNSFRILHDMNIECNFPGFNINFT